MSAQAADAEFRRQCVAGQPFLQPLRLGVFDVSAEIVSRQPASDEKTVDALLLRAAHIGIDAIADRQETRGLGQVQQTLGTLVDRRMRLPK